LDTRRRRVHAPEDEGKQAIERNATLHRFEARQSDRANTSGAVAAS
jgi:hypothetical protein